MNKSILYPVHEKFHTFQGEGVYSGRPASFIRLYGCPVQCPWCDSAGTWHKDFVPAGIDKLTGLDLAGWAAPEESEIRNVIAVITGGEPTIFDLSQLTGALHGRQLQAHLETSGGFPIRGSFDWITLSPKKWKPPLAVNVAQADEFKFIIESAMDIGFYTTMLQSRGYYENMKAAPIWLHPEWSKHQDALVLNAISDAVKKQMFPYRAGWQLHKNYRVDLLDPGSRPLVPLGGNPTLGF